MENYTLNLLFISIHELAGRRTLIIALSNYELVTKTRKLEEMTHFAQKEKDISINNIKNAIRVISSFFQENESCDLEQFFGFLLNKVLFIYVSTEDLDYAFRLFTILNDRGIPLRNSDILKSINLGALNDVNDKKKYARMWEKAEGELGDDFDRFLSQIRCILVKEKARLNLLKEFEDQIYNPKEKDRKQEKLNQFSWKKENPPLNLSKNILTIISSYFTGRITTYQRINLEIKADIPDGADEKLQRDITENCRVLKFDSFEFEE